jgi:hypothetical protein
MPSRTLQRWLLERPISDAVLKGVAQACWEQVENAKPHAWFYGLAALCFTNLSTYSPIHEGDVADSALEELFRLLMDAVIALDLDDSAELAGIANRLLLRARDLWLLAD